MNITDNRETILHVALRLFSEKGYDSVGIQEIVRESSVTKPTLYHYYGSKQGLLQYILRKYYRKLMEDLRARGAYQGDLIMSLTGIVDAYFSFARGNRDFFFLLLSLTFAPCSNPVSSLIRPYQQKIQSFFVETFKLAGPQHGNLIGHEDILAMSLTGILNHYSLGLLNGELVLTDDFVRNVVKQYMYGIYVL